MLRSCDVIGAGQRANGDGILISCDGIWAKGDGMLRSGDVIGPKVMEY